MGFKFKGLFVSFRFIFDNTLFQIKDLFNDLRFAYELCEIVVSIIMR